MPNRDTHLSIAKAATFAGYSSVGFWKLVNRSNELPVARVTSHRHLIRKSDLANWLAARGLDVPTELKRAA